MPLLAGASPVAMAAVAAGVMLGKTETAFQTASPLSAMAPKCGASPSRIAARSTSGLMPSSTRSRAGFGGLLFSVLVKTALFYRFPTRLDDLGFKSLELGMDSRTDQFQLHNSEIRLLLAGCGRGGGGGGLLLTCRGRGGTPAVRSLGTLSCCGRGRPVSSWLRRSGWLGRSRGRSATTGVADDGLVTAERVPAILPDAIQGSRATRVHRAARERGARASATVAQGMDPGGGAVRALGPQAAREGVADQFLRPPHEPHTQQECHNGGYKA